MSQAVLTRATLIANGTIKPSHIVRSQPKNQWNASKFEAILSRRMEMGTALVRVTTKRVGTK